MHGVMRSTLVVAVLSLALFAALQAAAGPPGGDYTVAHLVSDIPGNAPPPADPNLVNGWGLARSATSPWWVADNGPDPSSLGDSSDQVALHHAGTLRSPDGGKLVIDGLWALQFGNSGSNGDPNTLFFTAGPNDESDGLFGTITTRLSSDPPSPAEVAAASAGGQTASQSSSARSTGARIRTASAGGQPWTMSSTSSWRS